MRVQRDAAINQLRLRPAADEIYLLNAVCHHSTAPGSQVRSLLCCHTTRGALPCRRSKCPACPSRPASDRKSFSSRCARDGRDGKLKLLLVLQLYCSRVVRQGQQPHAGRHARRLHHLHQAPRVCGLPAYRQAQVQRVQARRRRAGGQQQQQQQQQQRQERHAADLGEGWRSAQQAAGSCLPEGLPQLLADAPCSHQRQCLTAHTSRPQALPNLDGWQPLGATNLSGRPALIWQLQDRHGGKTSVYTIYVTPEGEPLKLHSVGDDILQGGLPQLGSALSELLCRCGCAGALHWGLHWGLHLLDPAAPSLPGVPFSSARCRPVAPAVPRHLHGSLPAVPFPPPAHFFRLAL